MNNLLQALMSVIQNKLPNRNCTVNGSLNETSSTADWKCKDKQCVSKEKKQTTRNPKQPRKKTFVHRNWGRKEGKKEANKGWNFCRKEKCG